MSEIITRTVLELEQLGVYHELNKAYIDAGLAEAWKSATFDEATRKVSFYTVPQPSGDVEPVFTFTLPEVDFTEIYNMIDAVEEKVDKNAEDIAGLRTDVNAINNAETGILKQAKDYVDGKAKENADAIDILAGRADDLEATVTKLDGADTVEGSVKAQIKASKEELAGAIATTQGEVDALGEVVAGMYTNEQIDEAIAVNAKAIEDEVTRAKAAEETNAADIKTIADDYLKASDKTELNDAILVEKERALAAEKVNADDIDALEERTTTLEGQVSTLIGDDTGKSARTIANEELAKQLIVDGAKESLDTLEEIATWIQSHPDDASAMNKAIQDLEALIGTLPEGVTATTIVEYIQEVVNAEKARAEGVEAGLDERLQAVETAIGEGGSVETQITDAISELDADVKSADVEAGTGVQVQVTEVDGKVTNVTVTGNYDNTYDAKGNAAQALVDAKAYADEKDTAMDARVDVVEAAIGENGSVTTAIAEAQADADSALEQIAAVSYATTEQIQALWATE